MTKEEQLRKLLDREQERNRALAKDSREEVGKLNKRVRELEKVLRPLEVAEADRKLRDDELRGAIERTVTVARWKVEKAPPSGSPGIPTLLLSDLHVNQTVDPAQVLGVNAFGPDKARERLERCFKKTVDLTLNHMVKPSKDGIIVPVMGDLLDLLGGFVHTAERRGNPVGIDAAALVADLLQPGFTLLADALGGVRSYWVSGNHGRLTPKMPYEDRNALNLDYAVFRILEGRLKGDKRITMEHATGPRMIYEVCGYRFLELHGDPASGMPKGGDSESGAVNVIARGVKRLRSLHQQIGLPFDYAVMGHYHRKFDVDGALTNGSLPGFSEFASGHAFPYQRAMQLLFYVHPKYGVTYQIPVFVDDGLLRPVSGVPK